MGENHLTYFKIENFKRFDSFEMENIGQYNLLVGDNNVGKTSVLEGLCFDENLGHLVRSFINIFIKRKMINLDNNTFPSLDDLQKSNLFENLIKDISKHYLIEYLTEGSIQTEYIKIDFEEYDNLSLSERKNIIEDTIMVNTNAKYWLRYFSGSGVLLNGDKIYNGYFGRAINDVSNNKYRINMIYLNDGYGTDLLSLFNKSLNDDKILRNEFLKTLSMILPKVDDIRLNKIGETEYLALGLEDKNRLLPITYFGDGVVKITRILLEILDAKGKRLMIDEIETGIHFSRLKDFWKTVLKMCEKHDVQLFATTHSLECQRYFLDAITELGKDYQKEARNISLLENQEGNVESVTFDYEQFDYAMEIGFNTRGGFNGK